MKPFVLLCTGGIGSGKSFVVKVFNALGIPSYDCDSSAKELYDRDGDLLKEIVSLAGEDVLADGRLDRTLFAARIFSDPRLLRKVEAIIHPAVLKDFGKWKDAQQSPIVILESAILLEHPEFAGSFDKVVSVIAPQELRIMRVVERDSCTIEQVKARMARQWDDAKRIEVSDWTIVNDGRQALLPQILEIIETIKNTNYGKDRS